MKRLSSVVISWTMLLRSTPAQANDLASLKAKRSKSASVQANVTGPPSVPLVVT